MPEKGIVFAFNMAAFLLLAGAADSRAQQQPAVDTPSWEICHVPL